MSGEIHVLQRDERPFYTIASAAARLNVTERYVRKLLESGELKGNRFGRARRIPPEQIDSYIERTSDDQEAA